MATRTAETGAASRSRKWSLASAVLLILPLLALGALVWLFLSTGGGLDVTSPVPVEALSVERTVLRPGSIEITVRNSGPAEVRIAQAIVNDAVWPFTVSTGGAIPRLSTATARLDYPWTVGEAYGVRLFTTNAIAFDVDIPVALPTATPSGRMLRAFTLIGLYVGVIPVYLGLFWFPALRRLGRRWMTFLLAVTAGLLVFLGIDTLVEALDQAQAVPGPFQATGLIAMGAAGTFLLLEGISRRQAAGGRSGAPGRLRLAYMIALGIGLHNLGEGLAIGAAYNVGEIALGAFLVVGFIIQNITEGLGIIAPVLRDRPGLRNLALLGLLGGAPAIVGAWIGGFSASPTLALLFLAMGAGAVFQVVWEIARLIGRDTAEAPMPATVFSGVMAGMALLWVTGLLIK